MRGVQEVRLSKNIVRFAKLCAAITLLMLTTASVSAQTTDQASPVRSTYGITIGTPAGLNITTSQYFGSKAGLRLTGAYFPSRCGGYLAGGQAGIIWKLKEEGNSLYDVAVVCGYTEIEYGRASGEDQIWQYVGITGSYKWRSFFIEGGLSVGSGTYTNPQALLQIGLIFKTFRM